MIKQWILSFLLFALPLSAEINILAFSGSLREGSCNKQLLNEAVEIAKQKGAKVTVIDLRRFPIPYYDGDIEQSLGMPAGAKELRRLMVNSDAFIIATPEYNGSISGVLKNAIDWTSRTEDGKPSREPYLKKKVAILSASPSDSGGATALSHLKTILENVGADVVSPQVSVPKAYNAMTPEGKLSNPEIKKNLEEEISRLF